MPDNEPRDVQSGRRLSRRSVMTGAAATVAAAVATPAAATAAASPAVAAARPAPGTRRGQKRRVTLYAENLSDNMIGYGLEPGEASVPGPLIEMWEGDTLEVELVNNANKQLSVHPHGVDYSIDSDGTPMNDSFNKPGERKTYEWRTHAPYKRDDGSWAPGSAGYWHYHDHAMGTPHGTEGIHRGLYGGLIVRRRGDTLPDKQFTIVFNDMMINNRRAPEAPLLKARHGERVEFICVGHGSLLHTFHTHAHRWIDNRTGTTDRPQDDTRAIDNKDLMPGDSFGFQVLAGEGVGPGAWMYHCHVQTHSDQGMGGVFLVLNEDGSTPSGAEAAMDRSQKNWDKFWKTGSWDWFGQ